MTMTQLATRVDKRVKQAVEDICKERGLKMNRFIEDALIDKLEELEDIEELKKIREGVFLLPPLYLFLHNLANQHLLSRHLSSKMQATFQLLKAFLLMPQFDHI